MADDAPSHAPPRRPRVLVAGLTKARPLVITLWPGGLSSRLLIITVLIVVLANLLMGVCRLEEAEAGCRESLDIQDKLVRDCPALPAYRQTRASCLNNLGFVLKAKGKVDEVRLHRDGAASGWRWTTMTWCHRGFQRRY